MHMVLSHEYLALLNLCDFVVPVTQVNKRVKSPHLFSVHYLCDLTIPITRVLKTYGSPELSIDRLKKELNALEVY